ncbi:MAG: NAD(P)/FAD-dependent oxidoreductase [Psychroserpens sp.]|uniref:flavin monoamine oxidase family protein n=1 Tax=Psychroserpens sp. TaxID=2020870 RepID=UPI003002C4C3
MLHRKTDILIVGAGLTGLTLAYYLRQLKVSVTITEARSRIGGRIHTKQNKNQAPIDLGATWFTKEHSEFFSLLKSLELDVFEQHYGPTAIYEPNKANPAQIVRLPPNSSASYRIANGTETVIQTLAKTLDNHQIITNCAIKKIQKQEGYISVISNNYEFECKRVISTLPPFLLLKTIAIEPALPSELIEIMQNTHTWMHDSIKVGFTFKSPFWKGDKTSGTIYSNASPLQEFYDHSSSGGTLHALAGFMDNSFYEYTKDERQEMALNQLQSYYGNQVLDFLSYEELIWKDEAYTTTSYNEFIMPQQNNGHPLYQNSYLDNRFFIAGTETSPYASGKMEGAVRSAQHIFKQLKRLL